MSKPSTADIPASEGAHSPLPWVVYSRGLMRSSTGLVVKLNEADARLIVTAVNAHEELVAALRATAGGDSIPMKGTLANWNEILRRARALLDSLENQS